jgi:hypothetical protein
MISLEPGEKGRVYLSRHENVEGAPYCVVNALSIRQQREFVRKYEEMFELESGIAIQERMLELFKEYVVEVVGYSSTDPEDAFSQSGLMEILRKLISGSLITHDEKKS